METKKFIDILEIYNGKNQKSVENPDGKYPIYGSGGVMGRADEYICLAETVVIGRKGSINNPIFVTEPFWNVDTAFGLVARKEVLLPKYLFYFCRYFDFEKLNTTVTIPSLTKANLLKIEIPIPSIIEQKSIVTKLNLLTDMIQQRQEQLTKLDELIKARFVEMFGDLVENPKQFPCVLLGSIMTVMPQNGLYKPQSAYVQDKFGTPILRIDGFYNGKVTDFNNLKRLCCTDFEKERYLLVENDIVINRVNSIEYLGKCARISGLQEDTVFESNMMRFHLDDSKVNSTYITTVLCSQYIYRQILTRAKKAVNQASINQGDVQSLNVVVPPLSLQNQFADFAAEVDKSKLFAELFAQNACILAENRSK